MIQLNTVKNIKYPKLQAEMGFYGTTQRDLCEILDLSLGSVNKRLTGKTSWRYGEMITLCKHFNKNLDELFGE